MSRNSLIATTALLLALGANTALAGNLERATAPAAAPPITDWSGAFLGAQVGAGFADTDFRYTGSSADHDLGGTFIGLYGGYDFQIGANVAGIDLSYNVAALTGSTACPNAAFTCSSELENFGTIRGRYGRAFDDFLLYGAAGYAFGRGKASATNAGGTQVFPKNSAGVDGWTVALGAQRMLQSGWALRGEVAYYDLAAETGSIVADGSNPFSLGIEMTTVTIGVEKRW